MTSVLVPMSNILDLFLASMKSDSLYICLLLCSSFVTASKTEIAYQSIVHNNP